MKGWNFGKLAKVLFCRCMFSKISSLVRTTPKKRGCFWTGDSLMLTDSALILLPAHTHTTLLITIDHRRLLPPLVFQGALISLAGSFVCPHWLEGLWLIQMQGSGDRSGLIRALSPSCLKCRVSSSIFICLLYWICWLLIRLDCILCHL